MQTLTLVRQGQRTLVQDSRPRRFGSLFLPLRRSYLLVMPTILLFGALLCWTFGSDLSMISGALILGAVSLYLLFDLLARRAPLRLSALLAATLGLAYGLGTANTWFTLPRGDEDLGDFLHISTPELAYAVASVLLVAALLLCLGELYEKPMFGEDFVLEFNNRSLVLLTLGTLAIGASFARGSTGFMGGSGSFDPESFGRVGILASLVEWLSGPLLAMAVCISLNVKSRFSQIYTRGLAVLLFIFIFPLGRRVMVFAIVLTILGLRLGRYKIPYSPLKKAILLGLVAAFLYVSSIGFFYLRVAGYGLLNPTLLQRISAGIQLAKTKDYSDIKKQFSQNVEQRTFILGFLAQLEGYSTSLETAHGDDIIHQFELALPSILYPSKDVFFQEETLANALFGSSYIDEANSILTAGAVDFGVLGVFFYPLVAVVLIRIFLEAISESLPVFASCFIIIAACATLLEPETTPTAYFLIFRNSLLFGSVIWFIMAVPEFRIKNVGL